MIAAIVVLNAVLGFVQELGAERALLALRSAVEPSPPSFAAGTSSGSRPTVSSPATSSSSGRATACPPTGGSPRPSVSRWTSRR